MKVKQGVGLMLACAALGLGACSEAPTGDERDQSVGYRRGVDDDGYTSNGERGNVIITEINWFGAVSDNGTVDPDGIFIELQNKHPRPLHLTGWQLIIDTGTNHPEHADVPSALRSRVTYALPPREGGQPFGPNEYVIIAPKAGGPYAQVDYIIPELDIPRDFFRITLRDLDDRLIESAGSTHQEIFAGGYDLVSVRSMERVQLLFSNGGGNEASWHSFSYNPGDDALLERQEFIVEGFRDFTLASPGKANSPDYSGNTSSGSFE